MKNLDLVSRSEFDINNSHVIEALILEHEKLAFSSRVLRVFTREGVKKSKWKFKMAFAMKGGGSRGGLECHIPILKNDFFKNHLESFLDCENVFCT